MLARENRLTLHTQMVGAWALLLAHTSGQDDVVFGVVASGRPPDLPGVDAMVGLFINTLPLRARVPAAPLDTSVLTWLRELGAVQAELHGCEQTPLGAVQGWSEVPRTQPLFDSLLVLFNVVDFSGAGEGSLGISYLRDITRSSYPLVVRIYPEPDLILEMLYDPRRFRPEAIDVRLGQMRTVLEEMAAAPGAPVRQIAARLLEDEKKRQELGALDRRSAAGRRLKSVVPRAVRLSNGEIR
jgi:non-ribosomal peptide synthetase component F